MAVENSNYLQNRNEAPRVRQQFQNYKIRDMSNQGPSSAKVPNEAEEKYFCDTLMTWLEEILAALHIRFLGQHSTLLNIEL
jgi:hypothetical protein